MTRNKVGTPKGIVTAVLLFIAAAYVGWLSVRATALDMVSGPTARVNALAAQQPDIVLALAVTQFATARGKVDRRSLPAIRSAAAQLPLDGRPYLLIGSDYLRAGRTNAAIATLEAGRRLDPRQRWVNLLLLEHYLRTKQYPLAAEEFSLLARLVGDAQGPIANALAQMSIAPQTRGAVRATLDQDPNLERLVLTALANSNVAPSAIFGIAGPAGWAAASKPNGWGSALVDRLVKNHAYAAARSVWQRINGIAAQPTPPLLFNAALAPLAAPAPFNWKIASDSIAAVDMKGNRLNVDYYGRDSGELASQLLLLAPGNYRFRFAVSGMQAGAASSIAWDVVCANAPDRSLKHAVIPSTPDARLLALTFSVPADCPAQWLRLNGSAGEFPTPMPAVIDHLELIRTTTR